MVSSAIIVSFAFIFRLNRFSQAYYAIESVSYPGCFLRAVGRDLRFDPQDGSANFGAEASFRLINGMQLFSKSGCINNCHRTIVYRWVLMRDREIKCSGQLTS